MFAEYYYDFIMNEHGEKIGYGVYRSLQHGERETIMEFHATATRSLKDCRTIARRWRSNCNDAMTKNLQRNAT